MRPDHASGFSGERTRPGRLKLSDIEAMQPLESLQRAMHLAAGFKPGAERMLMRLPGSDHGVRADLLPLDMRHQEFEPPEALKETIKCFWHNSMDSGAGSSGFEVMPDGYPEIIFYFGGPCNISIEGILQPLPSPFMMGLLSQPALFYTKNCLEIIGIRCFPWTVFNLLGIPSGKNEVHILDHPLARLQSALAREVRMGKIGEALAMVKTYFLNLGAGASENHTVLKAGAALTDAKGIVPVSQVAAAAHATVRTLERHFKQSSGHSVKEVTGLMRFEQVRNHLWLDPDANLAGLAYELGYTDQSHLTREFKRYSGMTPGEFIKKVKKQ